MVEMMVVGEYEGQRTSFLYQCGGKTRNELLLLPILDDQVANLYQE